MAMPLVPPVAVHGMARQKAFHDRRDGDGAGFKKQMEMIVGTRGRSSVYKFPISW
jgi:hypothetical protein